MTSSPAPDTGVGMRRLAAGFGQAATAYAASRPGYPAEAVDWLVGRAECDVLDLGAGSGSLTASLAASGHRVVAAEPSRAMLAELALLRTQVPMVQSAAESLPFAPGSFDAVTVATAFHWFDAARALPEIARVLRTGGRLGLVWNTRIEADGWTSELGELLRGVQPADLVGDWGVDSVSSVEGSPLFETLEVAEYPFTQRLDRGGLIGLAASRSYVVALPPRRRRRLLESVGRLFDSAAGTDSTVELPYSAQCWCTASIRV